MLRHAIPDYRLPRDVLDTEIKRLLGMGVALECNVTIGVDISLEELRERHALLFLGLGAQAGRKLGIPGERGDGVVSGIDFLRQRKDSPTILDGKRVIVIGGGNTAMDAARSALRDGALVTLVYRRSEHEMPASSEEIRDARAEGVEFRFLSAPTRIIREGEDMQMIEVQGMRLGKPDEEGRCRPIPVRASTPLRLRGTGSTRARTANSPTMSGPVATTAARVSRARQSHRDASPPRQRTRSCAGCRRPSRTFANRSIPARSEPTTTTTTSDSKHPILARSGASIPTRKSWQRFHPRRQWPKRRAACPVACVSTASNASCTATGPASRASPQPGRAVTSCWRSMPAKAVASASRCVRAGISRPATREDLSSRSRQSPGRLSGCA